MHELPAIPSGIDILENAGERSVKRQVHHLGGYVRQGVELPEPVPLSSLPLLSAQDDEPPLGAVLHGALVYPEPCLDHAAPAGQHLLNIDDGLVLWDTSMATMVSSLESSFLLEHVLPRRRPAHPVVGDISNRRPRSDSSVRVTLSGIVDPPARLATHMSNPPCGIGFHCAIILSPMFRRHGHEP